LVRRVKLQQSEDTSLACQRGKGMGGMGMGEGGTKVGHTKHWIVVTARCRLAFTLRILARVLATCPRNTRWRVRAASSRACSALRTANLTRARTPRIYSEGVGGVHGPIGDIVVLGLQGIVCVERQPLPLPLPAYSPGSECEWRSRGGGVEYAAPAPHVAQARPARRPGQPQSWQASGSPALALPHA
jgi:hypothetical protein